MGKDKFDDKDTQAWSGDGQKAVSLANHVARDDAQADPETDFSRGDGSGGETDKGTSGIGGLFGFFTGR